MNFYITLCSTLRIELNIGIESGDQDAESHARNLLLLMLNKTEMQLIALMDFCIVLLIVACQL